jgi:hypothetical protein
MSQAPQIKNLYFVRHLRGEKSFNGREYSFFIESPLSYGDLDIGSEGNTMMK